MRLRVFSPRFIPSQQLLQTLVETEGVGLSDDRALFFL